MAKDDIVYDVPPGQFEQQVVAASSKRTVVVDFWAEWCAPCRALSPILERVVRSFGGRAALARVDIDGDRDVAMRYGVQSIPAVKVFRNGAVVSEFIGALPEPHVTRILSAAIPSEADELVAAGDRLVQEGKVHQARGEYERALEVQPAHAGALLRVGSFALEEGDAAKALETLSRIEENAQEHEAAQGLLARIEFAEVCHKNGGPDACRRRLAEEPDNLDARYNHACCAAAAGDYQTALEQLLQIVSRDKNYADQAARNAMVRIFALIGPRSELADTYRRKLAAVLY